MHPPHSWSSYKCPVRTNNDAEGWHYAINRVATANSINMYLLISILHDESSRIPMIVKLVKQKKMYRYQRKYAIQKQVNLDDLWIKYEKKSITSEFLNMCAKLMDHTED